MSASTIIFYMLAAITLGGGILAVTSPKIFRSAIYLLFSLIGIAGLYFWLNYEFIAAVQVVVYVGGIVVLIIFSIFLTQGSGGDMKDPVKVRSLFAGLACLAGYCLVYYVIQRTEFIPVLQPSIGSEVKTIGAQMLSTTEHGYLLPFEVVSMLLLAAMIGCIVIAIKTRTAK
jgi:NADH-quinone oxidoreductase subunit J